MALLRRIVSLGLLLVCAAPGQPVETRDYPIQPVPFTRVSLRDTFWRPRLETNRTVTIPHALAMCEREGRLDNFALAAGRRQGEYRGQYPFDASDVYKILEGASYALMLAPDPALETRLDEIIALVGAAQEPDGYLSTARTCRAEQLRNWFGQERWENLARSHELYNAGHLFEAAAAHHQATGKRSLLEIALRLADLLDRTFGPGKLSRPPGHQVVEMGLVKLYRITGEERYLRLAKFFLDVRGRTLDGRTLWGEYCQDHQPVLEQRAAVGHAVRAGYMYAGMADVAALTGDASYVQAIDRLWENVVGGKLYLTGGIGSAGANEGFTPDGDLPNMSAYCETCASIASVYWNHRLFLLHGESKYADVMERTLYNAFLSGVSLDGRRFFYPNPLASAGQHERSEWFGCACCPSNVTRFMASLPGYIYGLRGHSVYVNLYATSAANLLVDGQSLQLEQQTGYPWSGQVRLTVHPATEPLELTLHLRVPGWARGKTVPGDLYRYLKPAPARVTLMINGQAAALEIADGYAVIARRWRRGDRAELELPMLVREVEADVRVAADRGRIALERGPLVFCAEGPDNPGGHVHNLLLSSGRKLTAAFQPELLGGVEVIRGQADACRLDSSGRIVRTRQAFTAIPYYAWAHRGPAEMAVWLARDPAAVRPLGLPGLAAGSNVSVSFGRNPGAIKDGLEPASSADPETPRFHWRPHRGSTEWVQYAFREPQEVSRVAVYWADDGEAGDCRTPLSWRVLYLEGGEWKPVYTTQACGVEPNRFNTVVFETVRTGALRLEVQSQDGWSGGIYEWKVW